MSAKSSFLVDSLIVLIPILGPMVLVTAGFALFWHDVFDILYWMLLMVPAAILGGIFSLHPQVRKARIRLLRLREPQAGEKV
jgi:hypothetical protein